ncbi:HIPL1 protein-like [Ananas comosus]|uniref:HIPL1 protein-like n=1 Tax=Ananas comosus TaxID=4615 RepID=A0A6P5FB42_ANACO|nr:HIPL1 protein-like [Ananas comosus]
MGSLLFLLLLFFFIPNSYSFPLCTDSWAPETLKVPLTFCSYNGSSCCNATDDAAIEKRFKSMKISDTACSSVVKSILCANCDPFSAELFAIAPKFRTVPALCNSTVSASSAQSKDSTRDFCTEVWGTCKDIPILNSPFQPSLQGGAKPPTSPTKLTDLWQSQNDFCAAFGGQSSDQSVCFNGKSVSFNTTENLPSPKGLCLERISNGSYLNMIPHPDGSNRVFFSSQAGQIWLATVPEQGSGEALGIDVANPFLDLTDEVHFDTELGLMGLAFHPDYTRNGRFFVSYNCDKVQSASCSGRCSCNSDVGCDPTKLSPDNGAQPCQYQSVVAEYSVNSSSSTPSTAESAVPSEVRRIFTMGLPYSTHHGGQILFGPSDGYLYFMSGDGGNKGDPFNFAQNKKSLLGKIIRLDLDSIPSQSEINDLGLWGNYSIPKDNPSADDNELQPEIWAYGLRNPWKCSFDSERPSYFFCADVGQETYEEVDLISKGGNYGWRVYEGPNLYHPPWTPGGNTSLKSIDPIFPIMGYYHSTINKLGSASITGGYVYRSLTDPCMYGRYLYADLYATALWAGTETPESSGNYTSTMIPFSCSKNSPIPCDSVAGSSLPSLGYIYSFGEDNRKDVFVLTSKGVYRVVRPSLCNYTCPKEKVTNNVPSAPGPSSSSATMLHNLAGKVKVYVFAFFLFQVCVRF